MDEEKTCLTCKYKDLNTYEVPCCDCVLSKRWRLYKAIIDYDRDTPLRVYYRQEE